MNPAWPKLIALPRRGGPPPLPIGLLAGMRIRKKLIVLHTLFSVVLAAVLLLALRPAVESVVNEAEMQQAQVAAGLIGEKLDRLRASGIGLSNEAILAGLEGSLPPGVELSTGQGELLGIGGLVLERARASPGQAVSFRTDAGVNSAVVIDPTDRRAYLTSVRLSNARGAVVRVYVLAVAALLLVYTLIAVALELVVLPRHVYAPLGRLLAADNASRSGDPEHELISPDAMPADELGEIMRSRNDTIRSLRRHEHDLASALRTLEATAADLHRKNALLETAQKTLADADRLASLGVLSAGLAHEINTPLAVVKGLAERLRADAARSLSVADADLLVRVVGRLERLSESLLDFARVRPPRAALTALRPLVDEAWTLVRLDRGTDRVDFANHVPEGLEAECDADRMLQVLVNLVRNAVDASSGAAAGAAPSASSPRVCVMGERVTRDARLSVSLIVRDSGPGIDPSVMPRLFEPFASTRLDSRGSGLGLAVCEGIVREHNGVILARNRPAPESGAEFEIILPTSASKPTAPNTGARSPAVGTLLS
jgi:signal transduction histidine kinase